MNLQAIAAMDDCEHATGKPLSGHMREVQIQHPRTAKEIIAREFVPAASDETVGENQFADRVLQALRDGGYDILERVSVYKR